MNLRERFSKLERFEMDWRRLMAQGALILLTGAFLALFSALSPDTSVMHAHGLSFLPLSGIALLVLGLLELLDAFLAKEQRDFLQNLQVGVLDAVVGGLIFLSVGEQPVRFSLMIAAFLIARGIVRITLSYALDLPNTSSTTLGGVIAVAMGLLVWMEWPTAAGWFLSLCMNIEIAFRGWAIMMFALWVRQRSAPSQAS